MAILTINLGLRPEYKEFVDDFLKYISIFLILHVLVSLSKGKSPANLGLTGELFNDGIFMLFIYLIIAVYVYHMIVRKLIQIN